MSACWVGASRRADAPRSAGWVGTGQRADADPVGRPIPSMPACRLSEASLPRMPREPDDRPQRVARQLRMMARRASGGVRAPQDGRGLFKPLTRDVQWIGSSSSMDGRASVNGLSSAIQWMERWNSMDRTSHFNGLTITPPFRQLRPSPASLLLPRPGDSGRNRS